MGNGWKVAEDFDLGALGLQLSPHFPTLLLRIPPGLMIKRLVDKTGDDPPGPTASPLAALSMTPCRCGNSCTCTATCRSGGSGDDGTGWICFMVKELFELPKHGDILASLIAIYSLI